MAEFEMNQIQKDLLHEVAELDGLPMGAYNIRSNGASASRRSTENIVIETKKDKPGIDIIIKPGTKNESVHIPVILTQNGLKDLVYNDFFVGEGSDVVIVAGCGIHCGGDDDNAHDGIHTFYVEKGAKVKYIEKHYGEGEGRGKRLMNPTTVVHLGEDAEMVMETSQIAGIDDTKRTTEADLAQNSKLDIREKILTTGDQHAVSEFKAEINGDDSSCNIVSRTVARDHSCQHFISMLGGNAKCAGHSECDSIIMDSANVTASPQLTATNVDAQLIHEAAIGKIAGEQLTKLMTLGLSEKEAEEQIVSGFLR